MTLAIVQLAFARAWAAEQARIKQERTILERLLQVGWPPTGNPPPETLSATTKLSLKPPTQ